MGPCMEFFSCQSGTSGRWTDFKGAMAELGEKQQMLNNLQHDCVVVAKSLQSYPTLCDAIDGSPPSSPISGILQARILEWVAIAFSNA